MVIVLTGMQAINKKFLARIILASLNKFEYKGYTCDFIDSNIKIYNANNELVYKLSSIEGGVVGVEQTEFDVDIQDLAPEEPNVGEDDGVEDLLHTHPEVIDYFLKINSEIFEDGIKYNHFVTTFCSLDIDFGLTDTPRYLKENGETKLLHPHSYDDVIKNIKEFPYPVKVISGTFGDHFINKIKTDLPDEEVQVINIIRNPSASWLMNKKPESKWNSPGSPDLDEALDFERFFQTTLTSTIIQNTPGVTTIKFEELMKTGKLVIGNTEIDIRDDYLAFNDWINNYESQIDILMPDEEFNSFNNLATNYTFEEFYNEPDDIDEEQEYGIPRTQLFETVSKHFPRNLFADLGYSPLTKEEILKSK